MQIKILEDNTTVPFIPGGKAQKDDIISVYTLIANKLIEEGKAELVTV